MSFSNDFWQQTRKAVAIDKARGYFTLPAFTTPPILWRGASEIAQQLNYQASKNFTITSVTTPPSGNLLFNGLPFILCIKYRIGGTVYRYKLWSVTIYYEGQPEPFLDTLYGVPYYNGQVIKKNFTLELWTFQNPSAPTYAMAPTLGIAVNFPISIRHVKANLQSDDEHDEAPDEVEVPFTGLTSALPHNLDFSLPAASVGDNNQ